MTAAFFMLLTRGALFMGLFAMDSASFGISKNFSDSLDDVLDLSQGRSNALEDGGAGESSRLSGDAAYESMGLEAGAAAASFAAVDAAGTVIDSAGGIPASAGFELPRLPARRRPPVPLFR